MRHTLSIILILCNLILLGQKSPLSSLYSNYRFNELISTLKNTENLTAEESYYLGKSYHKIGNTDKAQNFLKKAVELDSANVIYRNHLAEFQLNRNEYTEAYFNYRYLIENDPENSYYYKMLGKTLSKMPATSVFQTIRLNENNKKSKQSELNLEQGKSEMFDNMHLLFADQAFEKAYTLNNDDIESRLLQNEYLLKSNLASADLTIRESIALFPTNRLFLMQGIKVAYRLKDYNDVLNKCDLFYSIHDSNLVVQQIHGMSCYQLKKYAKADSLLNNVVREEINSEIVHYYLGLINSEMEKYAKAAEYIETAVRLATSENLGVYYPQLGFIYERSSDYKEAIKNLKLAYSSTNEPVLLYHLARNYDQLYEDKSTALKYYMQFEAKKDSSNIEFLNYSTTRIQELKALEHFSK